MKRLAYSGLKKPECPACGTTELWESGLELGSRAVCDQCGSCWDVHAVPWLLVDTIACEGCTQRPLCESRPVDAVRHASENVRLADGTQLTIRPLLSSDRGELAEAYESLSDRTRHLRFFSPPAHLPSSWARYLTDLDYHQRFAVAALTDDGHQVHGLGVARWDRSRSQRATAEAAVTVVDRWQGRGVGTLLLERLVREARDAGIKTFTADVLWENDTVLERLKSLGADVSAAEPGVASVRFELPRAGDGLRDTALSAYFSLVASA